jgi:hypothetical protein
MIPENIIEICVAIDIAILGIAYPIIVDKISNIGDKYKSQYIPVLFNDEFPQKALNIKLLKKEFKISIFKLTLYLTLFSLLFLIIKIPPPFGWDNWFINNSAKYGVFAMSTALTIFFFIWLDKVVLFNGKSTSILTSLRKRYEMNNGKPEKQQYLLKAINELTFYAINKQDEHLQKTILEFYYKVFSTIRRSHNKNIPLVYPIDLYFLVNKLNIEVANTDNKKLKALEHRAVSGIWLLGEDFEEISISDDTYNWLWSNLYSICDEPRLVKMFWANSHQYLDHRLQPILPEYDVESREIRNQKDITKRDEERDQFLEFHFALGGLILYRKEYGLLNYFFEYTQSQPPKYILLPETMTQIFHWFEIFRNEYKNRKKPIEVQYYFPELDNLGNSGQVIYWICSYLSALFIRQYVLNQYYVYQDFTSLPNLPDDVLELSNWLDSVSYFGKCLNDMLDNKDLINGLGFSSIVETNQDAFKKFITDLKESITRKIGEEKMNAELSEEKINNFYKKSNEIISRAFEEYKNLFIPKDKEFEDSELKLSINGSKTLMSKSAFTEGDIPTADYDIVFANSIANNKIRRLIPNSFTISRTRRYLLNPNNVISALRKIKGNVTDFIIVGVNIGYELKELLDGSTFKNEILYIPSTQHQSQDVLYVLERGDLPAIEHKEVKDDEKKEMDLGPINKELKLYASVIDINREENKEVKSKWNLENEPDNLDLKVQISIAFLSVIYWKNGLIPPFCSVRRML